MWIVVDNGDCYGLMIVIIVVKIIDFEVRLFKFNFLFINFVLFK